MIKDTFPPFVASQIINIYINKESVTDRLIWRYTPSGMFTSQSYQKLLSLNAGESSYLDDSSFPWKLFWKSKPLAPKIHMFMWRVLHNGIGVLARVGRFVDGVSTECHLCHSAEETADHLFMQCPVTQAVMFASPLNFSTNFVSENTVTACVEYWLHKEDHTYNVCLGACL